MSVTRNLGYNAVVTLLRISMQSGLSSSGAADRTADKESRSSWELPGRQLGNESKSLFLFAKLPRLHYPGKWRRPPGDRFILVLFYYIQLF